MLFYFLNVYHSFVKYFHITDAIGKVILAIFVNFADDKVVQEISTINSTEISCNC